VDGSDDYCQGIVGASASDLGTGRAAMPDVVLWIVGLFVFAVACVWLVVLPFRLTKGVLHKWGYHAHCGLHCEQGQTAKAIQLRLNDHFSKGLRNGMQYVINVGIEDAKKMLKEYRLLPIIDGLPEYSEERDTRVTTRYNRIASLTDVRDEPGEWEDALSVALGTLIRRREDPAAAFQAAERTILQFANPVSGAAGDSTVPGED
jgi:hypothetical protein